MNCTRLIDRFRSRRYRLRVPGRASSSKGRDGAADTVLSLERQSGLVRVLRADGAFGEVRLFPVPEFN